MKILYLNGADNEGGAAKAATRLLHGIHDLGAETRLYVQRRFGDDPLVRGPESRMAQVMGFARPSIEENIFGIQPGKVNGPFSAAFLPDGLLAQSTAYAPDLIHLHWVARMMRLETLARFKVPIVWTLHDSWAFTGGCYLPGDCTRYRESCGNCPMLRSSHDHDLSRRVWNRKRKVWQGLNLTLIAPSRWMAERARTSSLFCDARIEVIPNGIDVQRYRPFDKQIARELLSLPQDKKLILFGAKGATSDRNKGFHLLTEALSELGASTLSDRIELIVFGSSPPSQPPDYGFKTHYLGWQQDDVSLALLYAAADVFVLPSLQENLPYTVMEAMACGTPCVAFDQGGVSDLIDHKQNGFLAAPYDPADLASGIVWVLSSHESGADLAAQSRRKVQRAFDLKEVTGKHLALYDDIRSSPRK
jgi:glycosyltransferase involved in cell wall biosynthesis